MDITKLPTELQEMATSAELVLNARVQKDYEWLTKIATKMGKTPDELVALAETTLTNLKTKYGV